MGLEIDNVSPSPDSPMTSLSDTLPKRMSVQPPPQETLRKMFDDARTQSNTNRLLMNRDHDYYDGPLQLQSEVRRVLKMRGQPAIYTNRIRPAVDGILGVLEGSKVDPRCYPRNPTPEDENAADVATKTLRYIADVSDLEGVMLDCAENFLIEGTEACIVEADGEVIPVTQIRQEEFFADPFSRRNDFKDAKYLGIAQWKDADDVKAAWPEQYRAMGDPLNCGATGPNGALDSTWQDRPNNLIPWVDRIRRRMMVVEIYYNQDRGDGAKWYHAIYCGAGVFVHELSPYQDVKTGETLCPIEAESCYVDRENNRYGRIRDMIPIQDEINARRSRLLHLANSRQVQVDPQSQAAAVDSAELRREAARADGVLPAGAVIVQTTDIASGQAALLQESKAEIERMGPTPAVLSQEGSNRSGRASLVLQQAGMTELARPLGRHEDFRTRIYQAAWKRAQQFWTGPMFIRVTDETKAPEFLKINEPVMGMVMQPVMGPDGQPVVDPMTGQPQMMPAVGQVGTKSRIAEMDMDIIVSSTPDTANLQQEVFAELMGIVEKVGLEAVASPMFALVVEMSPLQNKAEILEKIKAATGGEDPKLQQAAQMIEQLQAQIAELTQGMAAAEQENKKADTALKESSAELNEAKTALTGVQAMVEGFKAGQESVPEAPEPAEAPDMD